ncbi:hypothetical protein OBBRIDRAFT_119535 [Obba rivulosa]|uniref:Uncharacterized protein n=1 Tax=Obba rivulosa TaxID=1052685 RepID=A0A8E2AWF6_9APHY|nr:hypothetical protein OBBRIDRAFT_119535 [Obba rivulosa]
MSTSERTRQGTISSTDTSCFLYTIIARSFLPRFLLASTTLHCKHFRRFILLQDRIGGSRVDFAVLGRQIWEAFPMLRFLVIESTGYACLDCLKNEADRRCYRSWQRMCGENFGLTIHCEGGLQQNAYIVLVCDSCPVCNSMRRRQ